MVVQMVYRQSCGICRRVKTKLERFRESHNGFDLRIFDLDKDASLPEGKQPYITPAIWVNDRLWYLGGFDHKRFAMKITQIVDNDIFSE